MLRLLNRKVGVHLAFKGGKLRLHVLFFESFGPKLYMSCKPTIGPAVGG